MAEAIAKQHPTPRRGEVAGAARCADVALSGVAGRASGAPTAPDGGRSTAWTRG